MQKHSKRGRGLPGGTRNANRRVPSACTSLVYSIPELIEFGDGYVGDPDLRYLRDSYLSKFADPAPASAAARRQAAIDKFVSIDDRNKVTNARISTVDEGFNILPRVSISSFLTFARKLVARILGPLNDELVLGSFSSGASTSKRRAFAQPARKFVDMADVTDSAELYVNLIHANSPVIRRYGAFTRLNRVKGNILFTVPKKDDIDRCACKEPDINMYLQKGVGSHIRRRLKRFGIDLNDQSRNRSLARTGSITNQLATVDMSSASDSISIEVVRSLLPRDWFDYLNDIRSHHTDIDGTFRQLGMFSSMGNGFTFELESLIFLALARTVAYFEGIPGIISIYGDDLIIPSCLFDMCEFVFSWFGFAINRDKSFHNGPFRESCGGHYYLGRDITPFYLKRPAIRLTDVIRVANQLRKWGTRSGRDIAMPSIYNIWTQLASYVPRRYWGGYDLELDTQLVAPCDPKSRLFRVTRSLRLPPTGEYLEWHNSVWNRTVEPEVGFDPVEDSRFCESRRVRKGDRRRGVSFYQETD